MYDLAAIRRSPAAERVLILAPDADAAEPVRREAARRGADLLSLTEVSQATDAVRAAPFDIILVAAREDAGATALLLRLIKAAACGAPRILLLLDVAKAALYDASIRTADETMSLALTPGRVCDAAGVGVAAGLRHGPIIG